MDRIVDLIHSAETALAEAERELDSLTPDLSTRLTKVLTSLVTRRTTLVSSLLEICQILFPEQIANRWVIWSGPPGARHPEGIFVANLHGVLKVMEYDHFTDNPWLSPEEVARQKGCGEIIRKTIGAIRRKIGSITEESAEIKQNAKEVLQLIDQLPTR